MLLYVLIGLLFVLFGVAELLFGGTTAQSPTVVFLHLHWRGVTLQGCPFEEG